MSLERLLLVLGLLVWAIPATAQTPENANVVTTCGTPNSTYAANSNRPVTQGTDGTLCTRSAGGSVNIAPYTGTPTQTTASCTNADSSVLAAAAASKFIHISVPATAANGVWFNFAGAAATAATPNEYILPGGSITWSAVNGFVPTSAIRCISNTASTISISVTYS